MHWKRCTHPHRLQMDSLKRLHFRVYYTRVSTGRCMVHVRRIDAECPNACFVLSLECTFTRQCLLVGVHFMECSRTCCVSVWACSPKYICIKLPQTVGRKTKDSTATKLHCWQHYSVTLRCYCKLSLLAITCWISCG